MAKCKTCKTEIPDGTEYCINCQDKEKAKAIVNFLKWAETDGQKYTKDLYYAPLPKEVVKLVEKKISTIAVK